MNKKENKFNKLTPGPIRKLINSYMSSRVLAVASKLDIFTTLALEGKSAKEVARELKLSTRGTELLLNALCALDLLNKDGEKYTNTILAETFLVKEKPLCQGHYIAHIDNNLRDWIHLEECIQTGQPFKKAFEDIIGGNEEKTKNFMLAMYANGLANAKIIASQVDLNNYKKLLDLAGGTGIYSVILCQKYPQLKATVFDLAPALKFADETINKFNMKDRIATQLGDYNQKKYGENYDVVLFSATMHQEGPNTNRRIVKKSWDTLSKGGMIILTDFIIDDSKTRPTQSALFALEMLVSTKEGKTYSFNEIKSWQEEAGFTDIEITKTPGPISIITAKKH